MGATHTPHQALTELTSSAQSLPALEPAGENPWLEAPIDTGSIDGNSMTILSRYPTLQSISCIGISLLIRHAIRTFRDSYGRDRADVEICKMQDSNVCDDPDYVVVLGINPSYINLVLKNLFGARIEINERGQYVKLGDGRLIWPCPTCRIYNPKEGACQRLFGDWISQGVEYMQRRFEERSSNMRDGCIYMEVDSDAKKRAQLYFTVDKATGSSLQAELLYM